MVEAFIVVNEIGDEALLQCVEDGKLPNSYKIGTSYVAYYCMFKLDVK